MINTVIYTFLKAMLTDWDNYWMIVIYIARNSDLPGHVCEMIADLVWTVQQEIPF